MLCKRATITPTRRSKLAMAQSGHVADDIHIRIVQQLREFLELREFFASRECVFFLDMVSP